MKKVAVFFAFALLLIASCSDRKMVPAIGPYSDLFVFTEDGRYYPGLRPFMEALSHPITYVFEEENEFDVYLLEEGSLSGNLDRKNLLFLVRIDRHGGLRSRALQIVGKEHFRKAREKGYLVLHREDLYARGQDVYLVLMDGPQTEEEVLSQAGPVLRRRFRESSRKRYRDYLLSGRENRGGGKYLWKRHGFLLRYPKEYRLLQEEPALGALELHRKDPSRVLGVFWLNGVSEMPALRDSTSLLAFRARIVERLYGDSILGGEYLFEPSELGPYPALRLSGVWQNEEDMTGGPFVTYFLQDGKRERLLAVDLVLYAPGLNKHPYMRELEALASSFRFEE
ncbi:MAG: DUF4837 family protein [Candidatus Krumholzibacteria bacterium]|jgi:hypothetical protein|nr:DUF4837 family protein [Candidatus Krumholzibacteria bacterium]MDP6669593.1 DUF4837 family protein [Candidatus Krumholzibacteria bacterium]MDP6797278.1 DUF4837 family protein [Candidatus Krumholzibacteria bacterium]MDP7020788.1 DUF4837 family protein [Candidatus Krumholzibacteria bacterium]